MPRMFDLILTGLAPMVWGTTYIVTTEMLPAGYPLTLAVLRALPAGLLLLVALRRLPVGRQWGEAAVLGAVNFAIFWACLFVAAYRLPGGVAATMGSLQALIVIGLARVVLDQPVRRLAVMGGITGVLGVACLVLGPAAGLDPLGVAAGLGGAVSMATGTVLSRKWRRDTPLLTFTAWQLAAGGMLLLPFALLLEPALPPLDREAIAGLLWLGLIGAALTYGLWFRGVQRLDPAAVSTLGFLSPLTAVLIGWLLLGQSLSPVQMAGVALVLGGVWAGGRSAPAPLRARLSD